MRRYLKGLRAKLLVVLFGGILLITSISFYVQFAILKRSIYEDEKRNTMVITSALYAILEQTMAKGRVDEVTRALQEIAGTPPVRSIQILGRDMDPTFEARGDRVTERETVLTIPIRSRTVCKRCHGGVDPIGYLRIGFDSTIYRERLYRETGITLGINFLMLLSLMIMVYVCLQKGIFSRLQKLNTAMQYFGRGNLRYRIAVKGDDELSRVARAFNEMARNIYKINFRLYKVSELSLLLNRSNSTDEIFRKTVDFIMRFFDVNGADIVYRDSTVASEGKMEGIEYSEPIVVEHAEAGFIRVSTSKDFTVEELSALRIVANSVSIAIQTLEGVRPPPGG